MNKHVYIAAENIVSPVGITAEENFRALLQKKSGVQQHIFASLSPQPVYASMLPETMFKNAVAGNNLTKFEQLLSLAIDGVLQQTTIAIDAKDVLLIISSTKGNIALLETHSPEEEGLAQRIGLFTSAKNIAQHFKLANDPLVVSNACISGLTALLTGKRLLETGQYKHIIVAGADLISAFILSGFQSFQAISNEPCRPFDADRKGINLGEAGAAIVLSTEQNPKNIKLSGGAISNDANHISGPSRSGQELCIAINKALQQAQVSAAGIGFISAHGTATLFNDEMEAKAFSLAGMEQVPLNSLKGYYGHTLGAAGIVESVIAIRSLQEGTMIASRGYEHSGVSKPLNVCKENMSISTNHCLKTASGFGGCNAALVFSKT